MNIPNVDLRIFNQGSKCNKKLLVEEVHFLTLKAKSFHLELIGKSFHLTLNLKSYRKNPDPARQRGFCEFESKNGKINKTSNLKEFYPNCQNVAANNPIAEGYPKNVSVNILPEFSHKPLSFFSNFKNYLLMASRSLQFSADPKIIHYPSSILFSEQYNHLRLIT